ncbi:hypothetical protein COF09_29340 [Bacillus toyonensis]|nr:hypothetical protein COF09_29340 [Bacillus toyonensis]
MEGWVLFTETQHNRNTYILSEMELVLYMLVVEKNFLRKKRARYKSALKKKTIMSEKKLC